jgi:hypothetical protein
MSDLLNNIGTVIVPEAIRLSAVLAQTAVLEQLPYPSQRFREALKETAFGFFELTKSSFVKSSLVDFLGQSTDAEALDVIIFESFRKFPALLLMLEFIREQPIRSPGITERLTNHLKRPEGAQYSTSKGVATLRGFGLVSKSKGDLLPLSHLPSVVGFGYILHSEYPQKQSITAPLDSILENPFIRAYGCHAHEIIRLLEEGSTKKFWALERDNVFQRVVFPHTLETFVKLALEH